MVNTPETAKRVGKAEVDLALVGGELGSLNTGAAVDDDTLALNRCVALEALCHVALEAPWQPNFAPLGLQSLQFVQGPLMGLLVSFGLGSD